MSALIVSLAALRAGRVAAKAAARGQTPCCNSQGEIVLYPSDIGDGTWAVDHVSRSGDSTVRIGEWMALDTAIEFARMTAARTGADFEQRGRR